MKVTNIHEAKTHLSRIIERVLQGEEIIIGKAGNPVALITAYKKIKKPRRPGRQKGKIKISKDFDTLPKNIIDSFYNSNL